jgi:hypothetical protein
MGQAGPERRPQPPIAYSQLAKKETPHRGREHPQDCRQTLGEGQGFEGVAAFSVEVQSRADLERALPEAFEDDSGVEVSEATMSRNIARLPGGWPIKKSRP